MIELTLAEVAEITGGWTEHGQVRITNEVVIDSREVQPGGLFVAFAGEHVDGHDFVATAVDAGAAGALATRPVEAPCVVVADAQQALADLAREVLRRCTDQVRVIAITGSSGKTTVKDMVAQVLAASGPVVATQGSFNNELGMPLTVLRVQPETRYLVLEMGARGVGHLTHLTQIAPPDISVVLNVGSAHVGEFGLMTTTAIAKGEIVDALTDQGVAVINADDPLVAPMATRSAGQVVTYGRSGEDVTVSQVTLDSSGRPSFLLSMGGDTARVTLPVLGEHQVSNAAAVAACARACGMSLEQITAALGSLKRASAWRMEVSERKDGLLIINDAYNANPESVRVALQTLSTVGAGSRRRTVAVLGEMLELGENSYQLHRQVGQECLPIDVVVAVGEGARGLWEGAHLAKNPQLLRGEKQTGPKWVNEANSDQENVVLVGSVPELRTWLGHNVRQTDAVLFKASRSVGLEKAAQWLLADEAVNDHNAGKGPAR